MRIKLFVFLMMTAVGTVAAAQESDNRYGDHNNPPPQDMESNPFDQQLPEQEPDDPPADDDFPDAQAPADVDPSYDSQPLKPGSEDAGQSGTQRSDVTEPNNVPSDLQSTAGMVPVAKSLPDGSPAELLKQALTPTKEAGSLTGRPLTLMEILASREQINARHADLLQLYWRLSAAMANYYDAARHSEQLADLTSEANMTADLATLISSEQANLKQCQLTVVELQHELAELLAWPTDASLPLAADRPVVSAYRTHYQELFSGREGAAQAQRNARRLHDLLPLSLDALRLQAVAVDASQKQFEAASTYYRDNRSADPTVLLDAYRTMADQRRAFLRGVQDYNVLIAEYAVLAAPYGADSSALLPMLIKVPPQTPMANESRSQDPQGPRKTFSDTPDGSGVVPVGGELPLGQEPGAFVVPPGEMPRPLRSILVRRKQA